ncbi:MAG: hypothetical protein EA384_13035 [Spirochaetaceae bacterium]|nr:MAG: hypothetical protein EA384_13035 [Spirochaetaceae bacterium]
MRSMIRKFAAVYAVCALLFLLVLGAVLLIQLNDARNVAIGRSQTHFRDVRDTLAGQAVDGPVEPQQIQRALAQATTAESSLRAVAVYSFDAGLEYLWVRNRSYLANNGTIDLPTPATPEFRHDRISEIVLTESVRTTAGQTLVAEAVYRTLDAAVWYHLLRNALTAVLVFALVTVLVTLGILLAERRPVAALQSAAREPQGGTSASAPAAQASRSVEPASETHSGLFSPHSGVSHESHLERRLTLELERAASNDQDLSFALCRFPGISRGTETYRSAARGIIEQFLFEDLIFEQGSDSFAVIVPNTDLTRTIKQFELLYQQSSSAGFPAKPLFGLTARSGRLVEADRLIREAQHALGKAQREGQPIMAFKADPQKYRDYVAGRPQ